MITLSSGSRTNLYVRVRTLAAVSSLSAALAFSTGGLVGASFERGRGDARRAAGARDLDRLDASLGGWQATNETLGDCVGAVESVRGIVDALPSCDPTRRERRMHRQNRGVGGPR